MKLLVDIGNSRIKWGSLTADNFSFEGSIAYQKPLLDRVIATIWSDMTHPNEVIISNVAGEEAKQSLSTWCWALWRVVPTFLATTQYFETLKNGYHDFDKLGIDRWCAIVAAYQQTLGKPFVVIDAGTCLKLDAVDASGQHQGGFILPGLKTARASLKNKTQLEWSAGQETPPQTRGFGCSTFEAIEGGLCYASAATCERFIDDFAALIETKHSDIDCFITGGDAPLLENLLEHPIKLDSTLVLKGIKALRLNAQKSVQAGNYSNATQLFTDSVTLN